MASGLCRALPLLILCAAPLGAQDPIFSQSVLHETRLVMDPNDWRSLSQNYLTNQYYAANITLDGETLPQVGIRSRGAGSRNADKPGLKVDFNKYVSSQEFHGYKSLVLDNLFQDPSYLRERLAYLVFEAMGIASPQISHTRLYVNDEYWGLYALIEPISKPFLKARFGEESGNLFDYEFAGPYNFEYKGSDPGQYIPLPFDPETNENSLDPSGLIGFIRTANEAPDETFIDQISEFIDVREFLTYLAVENALAESDGFLGGEGMNNFYLYQYGGRNRFVFIPWDKDTAFSQPIWPLFQNVNQNVLVRRLLQYSGEKQTYLDLIKQAVESYVNPAWLRPRLMDAYSQIRVWALRDDKKPFTNEDFEIAVHGLEEVIEARRPDVYSQLGLK
jgi:spore coat protein CotH